MPCIYVLSSCLVHSWESGQNRTQQQQRAKPGKEAFLPSFPPSPLFTTRARWQKLHVVAKFGRVGGGCTSERGAETPKCAKSSFSFRKPIRAAIWRLRIALGLAKDAVESRKIQFRESLKMEKMEMQCHRRLQNKFNPLMVIEISFVNLPRNPNFDTMSWSFRPHFIPSWRRLCSRLQRDSIE